MPTIQKRNETYRIRVCCGYDSSGKKIVNTLTWKPEPGMTPKQIEKEVQRQALLFEEKVKSGSIVGNGNLKLGDFCPQYLELTKEKLSPLTREFYERVIDRHILPMLGHIKLKDIKPIHVQRFIQELSKEGVKETTNGSKVEQGDSTDKRKTKLSESTIRRYLNVLQSILNLACKMELIASNPARAEKLTLGRKVQPKIEIFTKQEAAEMLSCLEQEELKYQVLVQLAVILGARRGELVALQWDCIDFENSVITIRQSNYKLVGQPMQSKPPKDYEIRTISASEYCFDLLHRLKAEQYRDALRLGDQWHDGNWIFTQWNGEPMNVQTPTKWFSKFLAKYNLKHRKFHALRHTSATLLLCGGVNIKTVSARLGHADIETTNIYLHSLADADATAANVLQDMLIIKKENPNVNKA